MPEQELKPGDLVAITENERTRIVVVTEREPRCKCGETQMLVTLDGVTWRCTWCG